MVNLLSGNHVYLPDRIKFQRPLAAPLKMSTSSLQGQDHKTAETLFCDEIWICKTRLNLTPQKEKKVRRCFKTNIICKKKAFIRCRGGEMSFYMTLITAFWQRNRSLSPSPRTFCTCKRFLYAPSSATSFLPLCCTSQLRVLILHFLTSF